MDTPSAFLQNPVNPDGARQIGTKSGRYIFKPIFVALKATRHQRVGFPTRGLRTRESPQPTKPEKRHNCKEQSCRCCDANAGNPTAIGKSTTMNYLVNPKYRKDHQSQNKRGSSFQDGTGRGEGGSPLRFGDNMRMGVRKLGCATYNQFRRYVQ